ncbi:MAG: AraC family transcriptional regulator [Planctomycetes bacterium]|nr:AraC family transcriptional regulator [Planctomycetota bacterium]
MTADLISDVLRVVRLDGAYFYKVEATGAWWVESVATLEQLPSVLPDSEHLIPYHILVEGSCWGGLVGEPQVRMHPGDVLVFPSGAPHWLSSQPGERPPLTDLEMPSAVRLPFAVRMAGPGEGRAVFVCGFLGCDRRPFNPLLTALPEQMLVHGELDGWLSTFVRNALGEVSAERLGGELILTRLAELMFVDVVLRHAAAQDAEGTGWLAALRDEIVGRALALLHERPARAWTLEELALRAGTSRSVLAERFARLLGEPPMQYLTRWRMQLAAHRLASSSAKVAAVAREVGYESEAAFSRAFKREVGLAPAAWRARRLPGALQGERR